MRSYEGGGGFDAYADFDIDAGTAAPTRVGAESAGWVGINPDGTGVVYNLGYGLEYDTGTSEVQRPAFDATLPSDVMSRINMMMTPSDN